MDPPARRWDRAHLLTRVYISRLHPHSVDFPRLRWAELKSPRLSLVLPQRQLSFLVSTTPPSNNLPTMTGPMDGSRPIQVDEKHVIQPQGSSELDQRHSHKEVAETGFNEAGLHESEKDIPVRSSSAPVEGVHFADGY